MTNLRRLAACGALATGLVIALATAASAHAQLLASSPTDGSRVQEAPTEVTLTFSENVSLELGGLQVFDSSGARVDRGDPTHGDSNDTIKVSLKDGLGDGTYVTSYRVVSADGHPVSGGTVFAVGSGASLDKVKIPALGEANEKGWKLWGWAGRVATYGGALLATGLAIYLAWAHDGGPDRRRILRWVLVAAGTAVAAQLWLVQVQAALATGLGWDTLGDSSLLRKALGDGLGWQIALVTAGLALAALSLATRSLGTRSLATRSLVPRVLSALGLVLVATGFVTWGHAKVADPRWMAIGGDVLHVAVAAIWFGGLVGLGLTLWARRGDLTTAPIVSRFSDIAAVSVTALVIGGFALGLTQVGAVGRLTSTTYGRVLLAKVAIIGVVLAIALYNRRRLVPELEAIEDETIEDAAIENAVRDDLDAPAEDDAVADRTERTDRAWRRLRATVLAEALGLVAVVALTGLLVDLTPARVDAERGHPFESEQVIDGGTLQIEVTPNQAGFNGVHMYLFDETGRPADLAQSIDLEFRMPARDLGPITRTADHLGLGHFLYEGNEMSIAGTWKLDVLLRESRFEEQRVSVALDVGR